MNLDARTTLECVALMAKDHQRAVEAVDRAAPSLALFIDALVERMRGGGRLIYLGAGTSGRLGVLDASECPPTFHSDPSQVIGIIAGGDAALRKSSEAREDDPDGSREALAALGLTANDCVLGIAAGGTTPYVLGGLPIAKSLTSHHAMTGLLTCATTAFPTDCDHLIVLETGPELLTGSTRLKAGTATKLALNTISTIAFVKLGKTYGNLMVDVRATNDKLTDRAIRILRTLEPEISREEAARQLNEAGGGLKPAIVMAKLGVDRRAAERILEEHGGRLRAIIGSPEAGVE
jgi:N-acetylmuramic acid 6-phosphate etherase